MKHVSNTASAPSAKTTEYLCDVSIFANADGDASQLQTIQWAVESGVDVRVYGRGWEKHPQFAKIAHPPDRDKNGLADLQRRSRINLYSSTTGSVDQSLLQGLASGGFFLIRAGIDDAISLLKQQIWLDSERGADHISPLSAWLFKALKSLTSSDPLADPARFYAELQELASDGFSQSAATLWPEFAAVSFWDQAQLTEQIEHFLAHPRQRHTISHSMRRALTFHKAGRGKSIAAAA